MQNKKYEDMLRERITELRIKKNVSEHRMSLDLNKSGSYIRRITSGDALPSVRELFNIIDYFDLTPVEFFLPISRQELKYDRIYDELRTMNDTDIEKVSMFIEWIR